MDGYEELNPYVDIHRKAGSFDSMVDNYDLKKQSQPTFKEQLKATARRKCLCTKPCFTSFLLSVFPFIAILKDYKWKKWFYLDVVAGISVGVIHIPQGMGFALLTSLPPVYGLYSSFFPVLLYFFFGTSRHISVGTMALTSLMIGAVVDREVLNLCPPIDITNLTANATPACDTIRTKVDIAISVSLLVGCFQFLMGLLSLGIIATFMSMSFVGGFLVGATCHIITSQLSSVFGLDIQKYPSTFRIPLTVYQVCAHITESNVCAVVTAAISITVLIILKEVINEKFKAKMFVPIPAELIVVVLGTLVSYLADLHGRYDLVIVNEIPKGIPPPRIPPMPNYKTYISDSFIVALVSFAISISMAKLMALKHKYKIDINQELFAYGIIHGVSSFFNCFAGCQAPPRTLVHDSIGGKSQLASLVSCVLLLLVLMLLAPLFEHLPRAVLASIIIVALLPMFKQMKGLPLIGRINPIDLAVWIITFVAVVVLDISLGLFIGLGVSVFFVVLQNHLTKSEILNSLEDSELYVAKESFASPKMFDAPGVKVFKFKSSLYFVNVESFKNQLMEKTVNFMDLLKKKAEKEESAETDATDLENGHVNHSMSNGNASGDGYGIHTIVLDCSAISYIDVMGVNMLNSLASEYKDVDIRLYLANCHESVLQKLSIIGAVADRSDDTSGPLRVFPLVQDAVNTALANNPRVHVVKATYL